MVSGMDCLLHHLFPIDDASVAVVVIQKRGKAGSFDMVIVFRGCNRIA
jgi:hypothetical protein